MFVARRSLKIWLDAILYRSAAMSSEIKIHEVNRQLLELLVTRKGG